MSAVYGKQSRKSCYSIPIFSHAWAEAMVPHNICAGFKAAGVYSLDSAAFVARTAASDPNDSPLPSSSLKFVPMYSPIAPKNRHAQSFTQEEKENFQQRYDEGYDLSNDPKYFSWLHIHHPDEAKRLCELIVDPTEEPRSQQTASAVEGVIRKSNLSKFLELSKPPAKSVPPAKKSCVKVLTSTENLKLIEKKEREKREKIDLKESKRREREARREKIQEKEKKKQKIDASMKFTPQEVELFERRHENGHDLTIDSRYMLWLNSTHPKEAERLRSKNLQSTVETVMNNEVGGKNNGSRNQEGLSGVDQHKKLLTNSKNKKDTVSSSMCSTAKEGRNASLRTTKSATLKHQSTRKREEQAGRSTRKIGGSSVKKANGSTTISSTGTRSGRVTCSKRLKTARRLSQVIAAVFLNPGKKTAAKVSKIVTRSNKECNYSPSPAPESDTSGSLAITDYEEGEFLIMQLYTAHDIAYWLHNSPSLSSTHTGTIFSY